MNCEFFKVLKISSVLPVRTCFGAGAEMTELPKGSSLKVNKVVFCIHGSFNKYKNIFDIMACFNTESFLGNIVFSRRLEALQIIKKLVVPAIFGLISLVSKLCGKSLNVRIRSNEQLEV